MSYESQEKMKEEIVVIVYSVIYISYPICLELFAFFFLCRLSQFLVDEWKCYFKPVYTLLSG